jgi:putative mRNA 3-end processing factor
MKLKFLGGADVVGRLGMLLNNKGANLLFEYGMKPIKPPEYPIPAPPLETAFLTHCHIDHSGMIPWLCGKYGTKVHTTPSTIAVCELLMNDTLKVADSEGYPRPFQPKDIEVTMKHCFRPMKFGDVLDVAGFEVESHSAGHVPGAAMYELRGDNTTVFTGDLHTYNTNLTWGAHPVKCDNLIIEATYAGRLHPDRKREEQKLIEKVKETVEGGGKAIIPCFAVGRTQEVMLILKDLKYDMWVDGMGKTVNRLYLEQPEYIRSERDLRHAKRRFNEVRGAAMREKAMHGEVIVTTGGMLDGGPVIRYLQQERDNPKSAVLMTGYQVDGSNGRRLIDNGAIDIRQQGSAPEEVPESMRVACQVQQFDLSAHADHNELIKFIRACNPENVVLMHSDNRQALAKDLKDEFKVHMPMPGEEFEL